MLVYAFKIVGNKTVSGTMNERFSSTVMNTQACS